MGYIKEEKIREAKTIYEAISLLNKRQIIEFGAVIEGFQIHENNNYFLSERYNSELFFDICVKYLAKKGSATIVEMRRNVINYIMKNYKIDMEDKIIELAIAAARNVGIDELYKIAYNPVLVKNEDETYDEITVDNPVVPTILKELTK